jgi:hypothetical protein
MHRYGNGRERIAAISSMAGLTAICLIALPAPAESGDDPGMAAMRAADAEAALAANAQQLPDVRLHLQRALNCLEGPQGPEYRTAVGAPCTGSGAVNELRLNSVNHIRVGKAIRLAAVGVTFHDFKPAHFTVEAVRAVLDEGML